MSLQEIGKVYRRRDVLVLQIVEKVYKEWFSSTSWCSSAANSWKGLQGRGFQGRCDGLLLQVVEEVYNYVVMF